MLELRGLNEQFKAEREDMCMIVLYGKIKGEDQYREHQITCINVTKSGINVKYTIQRLVQTKRGLGITTGSAISNIKGYLLPVRDLDACFHELLSEIYESDNILFPPTITN